MNAQLRLRELRLMPANAGLHFVAWSEFGILAKETAKSARIVNVATLNFRNAPEGKSKAAVFLGQRLSAVRRGGRMGRSRRARGRRPREAEFRRDPLSAARETLVASVHDQWMRFKRGRHVKPFSGLCGEMRKAIG